MWWPEVLSDVTMFRAFHEKDEKSNAKLSRSQFFFMVFVISFSYYIIPGYFFPSISAVSVVCLIWKRSIIAQQLGSGLNGFGIGSFGLDWSTSTSYTGNPIYYPFFVIVNTMVGFIIFMYIVVPFAYWTNSFKAKSFPIISPEVYDVYGGRYNLSRVLDGSSFQFKQDEYESYSELYLSIARACSIGFGFAALAASLTNIVLSHGRSFWNQLSQSTERKGCSDIHMQMMNKYRSIPMWCCILLTISMIGLAVFACEGFGNELQLPYWGVMLACLLVLTLVPPLAALRATACQREARKHTMIGM
nr:oligopeptide transporter 5-like isoform X2 [Aegilops tauschii subsp. strangulata]